MATTSNFERPPAGERTAGRSIAIAGDRTDSFKKAKRHSTLVRALRVALPLVSLAVVGIASVTLLKVSDLGSHLPEFKVPDILPDNLTMDDPHYEGFGKDGSSYTIAAKTAQQDLRNTSLIKLNGITGLLTEADKGKTELVAAHGVFDRTANVLELEEAIGITSDKGLKAKLTRATVLAKEGLVTSQEPVSVEFPGGSVQANSLTLRQKTREVTFVDAVKARLQPAAKPGEEALDKKSVAGNAFAASDAPVDITAQRLDIKDGQKTALFTGDVIAVQGDAAISTPELEVLYAGDVTPAVSATPKAANPAAPGAGKVSKINAKGPVTMTRGAADRVTCDAAEFDTAGSTAVLTGRVVMTSGADRRAASDRADLDSAAGTALLTGAVLVTSGTNELKGRRLFVDRKAQRLQLTAPGARITARFTQAESKPKPGKKPAAAQAAGFATFKTDPNAPVDIEADSLDANDAAKVAVFRGAVKASQGAFVIRTPELQATYSGEAGLSDVAGTQAPGTAKPAAQLTRIEAKKKVVVTSADGQTVNGDWAIFDTAANTVTVGGDVMLAQGKNVIRGTRLHIDMASGESTIETAPGAAPLKAGTGGWSTTAPDGPGGTPAQGRPSAVFYPDQLKEMRDGKPDAAARKAPDAWKASTTPQSSPQSGN